MSTPPEPPATPKPSGSAPRKRLPVKPSEEHLRKQAKRLAKQGALELAAAQHQVARDYGCKNWAELIHVVEVMNRGADQLAHVKREVEPLPKAIRARDIALVRQILQSGTFTQHDLDAGLAHAAWYGGDDPVVLEQRKALFDLLLDHGADPDGQYGSNYGPIVFGAGECLDAHGLRWLLQAGADVTFPPLETKYGRQCPLGAILGTYARGRNAAKHEYIELLLERGAFIPPEATPAMLAIHRGDAEGLARLLQADSALARRTFPGMPYGNIDLRGATLLHCAVEFDELECCRVLLDHDADINATAEVVDGAGGQTPIYHLINTGWASHFATLEFLVARAGAQIDMTVRATWRTFDGPRASPVTPLEYAKEPGDEKWRKNRDAEIALLESLDRRSTIASACGRGDAAGVAGMLDQTPGLLTPELWPPTYKAKSLELTRLLLDRGLDPNVSGAPRRPIDLAAYHALPEIVELLIARGAHATGRNQLGETPMDLLEAYEPRPVGDAAAQRVRELLRAAGAAYDLHAAVRAGDLKTLRVMLDADNSLANARPGDAWGPLSTAARAGRVEIAEWLLERGADANARNPQGNTPLWFACQSPANAAGRVAVARVLIAGGAQVRAACEDNTTAFHFAAARGPLEMVELLIRSGAKEWQEDARGKRPIDYAREFGRSPEKEPIIALLDRPVIRDPIFRQAVNAIHTGDAAALRALLREHPRLIHDRALEPDCYGQDYFRDPKLIWFIANNPNLIQGMPANILETAKALISAGPEPADLNYTLGLVMTSRPAREANQQRPLMRLLLENGAAVSQDDIYGALAFGEKEAIAAFLESGMALTAPLAAGLGLAAELPALLKTAAPVGLHAAFSLAVINREVAAARLCLDAGADVNGNLLVHKHSTAAHQAAVNDDVPMLTLLVDRGANLDIKDSLWNSTPLGWAIHTKKAAAETFLRGLTRR